VVHRIDRETSGLVLFARTATASAALKAQFEEHTPERVYQAVVLGRPQSAAGTWRDLLAWDTSTFRQRRAHGRDARRKEAVAHYTVREQFTAAALVEVSLVTGKRNQIRVQAGLRGHPLLGERQYRFGLPPEPASLPALGRYALHAWRLGFAHPATGEQVRFEALLPADMAALLRQLREGRGA
jgi:23S rRNA pseudouridine1911/1915/1917 synthase